MLVNFDISNDDVMAFIEVVRSVQDRNLNYVEECNLLMENGFYDALIEKFGCLDNAKTCFQCCISKFPDNRGGLLLLISYIDKIISRQGIKY